MKKIFSAGLLLLSLSFLTACGGGDQQGKDAAKQEVGNQVVSDQTRIVSLNGSVTEILCGLGLEKNIVGTDVTSTFPATIQDKPKVGHNRNMSAEAIIALKPDLIVGTRSKLNPELITQLQSANIKVILFDHEYSVDGAKQLVGAVADSLGMSNQSAALTSKIDADIQAAAKPAKTPAVLFIYARGAGTMMVGGANTEVDKMISLAGGKNAVTGFEDFKPLTAEALVAANPDVILMFDSGLSSLGGLKGLQAVQGMSQTNAGKNGSVIEMDGQYLTGFGPRTGQAIAELSKKLADVVVP